MLIPDDVRTQLIEHAEAERPNEACGLIVLREGTAIDYRPGENLDASPYRFRLKPGSPDDVYLEDEGFELALFHSHIEAPPRPSRTDAEMSDLWPHRPWVILSLKTGELAAWRIDDGRIERVELAVGR